MKVRLVILFVFSFCILHAQSFVISENSNSIFISKAIKYFVDKTDKVTVGQLDSSNIFESSVNQTPVFDYNVKNVWTKFYIRNNSAAAVYLDISYTNLSKVTLYQKAGNTIRLVGVGGNSLPINTRLPGNPDIVFNLNLPENAQSEYFLHVQSIHPIILPLSISTSTALINSNSAKNLSIGFYFGLLAVIFLYNFFLFVSTRDVNYLLYILYILCLFFAQLSISGFGYYYLWPSKPDWNKLAVIWTSYLSGMTALIFSISFLRVKAYAPKILLFLKIIIVIYIVGLISSLLKKYGFSYLILNYSALLSGVTAFVLSIYISKKGYRPAIFYLIAWTAFLISVFIVVARNITLLPYNNFTSSALYIGSSIEVTLLSIALADRINVLKKEKEQSQAEALHQAKENEILVTEQNILLEQKVAKRTNELQSANLQLNQALDNLKDTQTQLVEVEKMASLGQLTAGIAHEINNPINFVKSNINPLRLDIRDLVEVLNEYGSLHNSNGDIKQQLVKIEKLKREVDVDFIQKEIDSLILGIEEGAERTAEIVKGLRTFSRLDESALKEVNVHDGLESTLVILKNSMPYYLKLIKNFNANGDIECYPGKLNQVFMNMITNAIQSIKSKPEKTDEECVIIETVNLDDDNMQVKIKDTGIGMTEEVKHRIFEPFFTTKDVGEGTGLGMAITFKIIQKHNGKIDIISEPGKGAEFIITLPRKHPVSETI